MSRALERILWEPTSKSIFVARLRVDLLQSYEYSSNHAWEMYLRAYWGVRGPKMSFFAADRVPLMEFCGSQLFFHVFLLAYDSLVFQEF